MAAQLVMINHMRAMFFVDFADIPDRDLLTLAIDAFGRSVAPALYQGAFFGLLTSGPDPSGDIGAASRMTTLLGNTFFVQTIETPIYGTNSPLWSLANEFWYYVLFVLGLLAVARNLPGALRIGACVAALVAFIHLPMHILLHGLIWLGGAVLAYVVQSGRLPVLPRLLAVMAVLALAGALLVVRFGALSGLGYFANDALVGATLVLVFMTITYRAALPKPRARFSGFTAEYSYTIYLVHFPIVMLIAAMGFAGQQVALTGTTFALFCAILGALNLLAYLFYWLFEAHTAKAQRRVGQTFGGLPAKFITQR